MIKKRLTWMVIACAGIAALVAGGVASAEIVRLGNIELTVDGSFKPTKLPKHKLAPITLKVSSDIKTLDGTQPPVLNSLLLEFDKNGTLNTKGLPTCKSSQLENTLTAEAKRKCKDALVGKGSAKARIDFPDQDPFDAPGPLLAFNGKPKGGKPVLLLHVFAHVPAPTTFVVPATISNDQRRLRQEGAGEGPADRGWQRRPDPLRRLDPQDLEVQGQEAQLRRRQVRRRALRRPGHLQVQRRLDRHRQRGARLQGQGLRARPGAFARRPAML